MTSEKHAIGSRRVNKTAVQNLQDLRLPKSFDKDVAGQQVMLEEKSEYRAERQHRVAAQLEDKEEAAAEKERNKLQKDYLELLATAPRNEKSLSLGKQEELLNELKSNGKLATVDAEMVSSLRGELAEQEEEEEAKFERKFNKSDDWQRRQDEMAEWVAEQKYRTP